MNGLVARTYPLSRTPINEAERAVQKANPKRPAPSFRPASGSRFHQGRFTPSSVPPLPSTNHEEGNDIAGLIWKEAWHNPKLRRWSSDEGWLWFHAISFTADHEKDTVVIGESDLIFLCASHRIPQAAIGTLAEKGGLDSVDGGYKVHNYKRRAHLSMVRARSGRLGGVAKREANGVAKPLANTESKLPSIRSGVGVGVEEQVFNEWCQSTGKTGAQLLPKRRTVIRAALKAYPLEDVLDAVRGWVNDGWAGRKDQLEIHYLIGDGQRIEKFRDLWRRGPSVAIVKNPALAAGREWMALADQLKAAGQ